MTRPYAPAPPGAPRPHVQLADSAESWTGVISRAIVAMDTLVSILAVGAVDGAADRVERAFGWFREVEARCSRFDLRSELMGLSARVGEPVAVSPLLFEALRFALAVARASGGAFDPTVGRSMAARGFDRNYRTGERITPAAPAAPASYRDVRLDPGRRTVTLRRPLVLDLGAVAKGLAVDLAARELGPLENFAIDAGGDLYLAGRNPDGAAWRVGIPDPERPQTLLDVLRISGAAVCSSGGYARASERGVGEHHILDPRTDRSPRAVTGVTVVAPTAMAADALGTAAFVLGPRKGLRLLREHGAEGLILMEGRGRRETPGFARLRA